MLEGPPGVGKSALVQALADVTGNRLVRINLSDQTDIVDLFGTDLPDETQKIGSFAWKDGPFLAALRSGSWILLDELNLATQSVLEGLNACLDHRGEIYIPELDRKFSLDSASTKIFATQNPAKDGFGRKGLPKSFTNRFVKVYVTDLDREDIVSICLQKFPARGRGEVGRMSDLVSLLHDEVNLRQSLGHSGSPWPINLRDLQRWCQGVGAVTLWAADEASAAARLARLLFVERFRTESDREKAEEMLRNAHVFANAESNRQVTRHLPYSLPSAR
jgi:midasin